MVYEIVETRGEARKRKSREKARAKRVEQRNREQEQKNRRERRENVKRAKIEDRIARDHQAEKTKVIYRKEIKSSANNINHSVCCILQKHT